MSNRPSSYSSKPSRNAGDENGMVVIPDTLVPEIRKKARDGWKQVDIRDWLESLGYKTTAGNISRIINLTSRLNLSSLSNDENDV